MNTTQETSVTSSQDRCCTPVQVLKKGLKIIGESKAEVEGSKLTIAEIFPWITEFKKKCRCSLAQPNIVALIKLMKFYARNVSINVNECYTKPYRAAKLKDSISETLVFFLFYFRELVEVCDKNSYLDKMSDLLAMYLDMELKASRRGKEHHTKISARLTSCLYVYLENSSEHILDTFIKAKFINRNYHDILEPVLTKISKLIDAHPNCDTMYVRYLLIYRLWKKVNNDAAVKNEINTAAILNLGPPPPSPTPFLAKYVLPKVPKSQANSTKFLLMHKFDIEKSCRLFIQYCKENREDEDQGDLEKPNSIANTSTTDNYLETLDVSGMICRSTNQVENLVDNVNILADGERRQRNPVKTESLPIKCASPESIKGQKSMTNIENGDIPSKLKPLRHSKAVQRLKTKKNRDILFIDLTEDEITEKVIKKKTHRKLHWLTEIKKKLNTKNIKALEKKKKLQILPDDLPNDLTFSGLVDSTSTRSLSTASTPEPPICLANDFETAKSLSTATTPEPDNCVTSNYKENESPLDVNLSNNQVSEPVEKLTTHNVTTTVTESTAVPQSDVPSSQETLNPTTAFINTLNQSLTNSSISVTELSNALNHISESYDSDNNSTKEDHKSVTKIDETDLVEGESIPVEHEEILENVEEDESGDSEKMQRTSSESSEIAVIFTRRASDVEIVDLDEYTEVCEPEKMEETSKSNDNDMKNLTLQTEHLVLTNSSEPAKVTNNELSKIVNEKLVTNDSNTILSAEKLETLKPDGYDILKHCDYKSKNGEQLDNVDLPQSNKLEIAKSHTERLEIVDKDASSIQNEYIEDRTLIPKINEIFICTKNNLLTNQEPQFSDNIDGLSLLASVSQHVSHLEEFTEKSLSRPKIVNEEIACSNFEHNSVADLKNKLLNFTKSQIDDKIEDVSHPIKDEKLFPNVAENDSSADIVPLLLETTVDLNSSKLHNNLISVENVTQMIKESTNVIVNGETVVLFQKSPNSNLYIINKAVDGTMECLSEDKKNVNKDIKRNSTTMRDIINHFPINQDVAKNHNRNKIAATVNRSKMETKKADNSIRKYEKQLKPIRVEFPQFNDTLNDECIKKEIKSDFYEDSFRQRCTDTPGSVVELETVKKSLPPVIRITDTPLEDEMYRQGANLVSNITTTGRWNEMKNEGTYKHNIIKQELNICADNFADRVVNSDFKQALPKQNYSNTDARNFYPVNDAIPNVYTAVTTTNNLYSIDRERCSFPSCSLKVSSPSLSSQSYENISQSVHENCQLSHCACIKCAYELRACRPYVERSPVAAARSTYLQTESYFYSEDVFPVKQSTVEERELKINEAALAKLNDDQLLHNIEKSILDGKNETSQTIIDNTVREIKFEPEFESKLPLKKRIKAHAMLSMSYGNTPAPPLPAPPPLSIKIEKVENYPSTPMMSIAALEARNVSETSSNVYADESALPSSALESSPRVKDDSLSNHTREMIRRDYLKDTSLTSIGNCANVDDRVRKFEQQKRQTNSHINIMATGCQRSFKTPAQRKEVMISSTQASMKRPANSAANYPKSPKKAKKTKATGNNRQTRSSKRNIPKVDYSYDGIIDPDIKFNSLSELRRKRKKTSR